MPFTPEMTVADAIRNLPEAIEVFEAMEIDYSCQGARSLADAAENAGYPTADVIGRLESARADRRDVNWFQQSLASMIDYLVKDHRRTIGEHLPALRDHIDKVAKALGDVSDVRRIRNLFSYLSDSLASHVFNEERELFPFINHLDAANNEILAAPKMRISQRVLRELVEHESFRDRLRTLNELAQRLPAGEAIRAFRSDLYLFSQEIKRHMHLENNVLYPRAIDIENGLRRTAIANA
ncbi:MAG TPA: DUF542 domain-containing protein [Thermoanaerobaculia bacterium]|nr:DUF542 domain-containing protein [Thermoanaerobaculia bacterium]